MFIPYTLFMPASTSPLISIAVAIENANLDNGAKEVRSRPALRLPRKSLASIMLIIPLPVTVFFKKSKPALGKDFIVSTRRDGAVLTASLTNATKPSFFGFNAGIFGVAFKLPNAFTDAP